MEIEHRDGQEIVKRQLVKVKIMHTAEETRLSFLDPLDDNRRFEEDVVLNESFCEVTFNIVRPLEQADKK